MKENGEISFLVIIDEGCIIFLQYLPTIEESGNEKVLKKKKKKS